MAKFLGRNPKLDPSMRPKVCEVCGIIKPLREMKSVAAVYRMPGYDHDAQIGLSPFQCEDRQHYGCTHEHALLALLFCLFEHIHEGPHEAQGNPLEHNVLIDIQNRLNQHIEEVRGKFVETDEEPHSKEEETYES